MAWDVPYGSLFLELDPLSGFFLIPVFVLCALAAVYGADYLEAYRGRKALAPPWFFFNLLVASMVVVILARNGVLFLMAWEMMALSSFFLVTFEDEKESTRQAGWIYLVASHIGTAFLLVLFVLLGRASGSLDFDRFSASSGAGLLFVLALVGFGTKAGFIPLHVWLPEAHPAAPSHVSAVMSAVMIKTGIYGLVRVMMLLGAPQAWWGWVLCGIGLSSGVIGVILALAQHDLKRLLAYHSVENIGIILMGLGAGALGQAYGHPSLAILGYGAALLHTLNHALFKSILFLAAGAVYRLTGTRNMEELGGLARRMPLTWLAFVVGSAAIIGVPPLNGFVSEWLVFQTLFRAGFSADALRIAVLAVPGLALVGGLALACFVKVGGVVFLGTPRSSRSLSASKPGLLLDGPPLVLAAVCVFIGCLPVLVLPPMLIAGGFVAGVPLLPLEARAMAAAVGAREISIMAAVLALTAAAIWLIAQGLRRTVPVRQSETWGCGYPLPSARMQYTASSFAAPLLEIFGKLSGVRAHRGASVFHSESVDLILDGAVVPWWAVIERAALRLRPLQQGRLSRYLMYVISTVVALLAYLLVRAGDR